MMNRATNERTYKAAAAAFCKFCEGAGETKQVYTSHWQFSKPENGVLTCPKLLAYQCKVCKSSGHIEKRCPNKDHNKDHNRDHNRQPRVSSISGLFCKFCFNAKKQDYNEHNQFGKDGFVQCPVLLEIECQSCFEKGHTKSYCPQQKQEFKTPTKTRVEQIAAPPAPKKTMRNRFSQLEVIEEEETFANCRVELFPKPTVYVTKSPVNSWAARLTEHTKVVEPIQVLEPKPVLAPEQVLAPKPVLAPIEEEKTCSFVYTPSTSWADDEVIEYVV